MQTRAAIDSQYNHRLNAADNYIGRNWRRGRDSNPRTSFGMLHTFQACAFDRSATSPHTFNLLKPHNTGGIDSGHPGPPPSGALRASKIAPGDFVAPSNTFWDVTHFPGERLRPLGHLSTRP